jgi:hypothetical protein
MDGGRWRLELAFANSALRKNCIGSGHTRRRIPRNADAPASRRNLNLTRYSLMYRFRAVALFRASSALITSAGAGPGLACALYIGKLINDFLSITEDGT